MKIQHKKGVLITILIFFYVYFSVLIVNIYDFLTRLLLFFVARVLAPRFSFHIAP